MTAAWTPAADIPDAEDPTLYPVLSPAMVAAISERGACREFAPGDMLFAQGQRNAPFFVVEQGEVVFFDRNRAEQDVYFARVSDGMFIGDTSMFTGEPTVAESRARVRTRVLVLTHEQLRALVREHSEAGDLILRTLMARRAWLEGHGYGQLQILGPRSCPGTYTLREFFGRNQVPFVWRDLETDKDAQAFVEQFELTHQQLPLLIKQGEVHRNPNVADIARCMGLAPQLKTEPYDVVVVGAGPGGLAAAVYGASEGLETVVLDATAPGGQAATSSRIENYLGFTTGISGNELARQGVMQARKFGATMCSPVGVESIQCEGATKTLTLTDGQVIQARAVILATGARYRKLEAENCDRFEGVGLYYAAGHLEAVHCTDAPVAVVGGGNSAGQAAIFLSQHASKVCLVVRRSGLHETMSDYLIRRIVTEPNIEVVTESEVSCLHGGDVLEHVLIRGADGSERKVCCAAIFAMIGAVPQTAWLQGCCGLDEKGFVATGQDAKRHPEFAAHWRRFGEAPEREPHFLETTRPGIFAVGDVRSGSVKRVAAAVGDGAMAVTFAHAFLGEG
ncbi:MAG: FAD-dependent oxidoreductase [Planctomycetota bacterium]